MEKKHQDLNTPKSVYETEYVPGVIRFGRLTNLLGCVIALIPPLACTLILDLHPGLSVVLSGFLMMASVSAIGWFVQPIAFFPVLGLSGTYMAFLSGNIANLRLPAAAAAISAAGVQPGSEQGSVMATIGIAMSIIVNTVLLTVGVILGYSILSRMPDSVLSALNNILPALLGAMLAQQLLSHVKIGAIATALTTALIVLNKIGALSFLGKAASLLIILVSVFGSIFITRAIYNKKNKEETAQNE